MNVVLPAARAFLAIVFLAAALGKLTDLGGLRTALGEFGVPRRAASLAAPLLVVAELAVALALALAPSASAGAAGALALLAVFAAGVGAAMSRGEAPECHCFGQLHSEPAGARALWRNAALAAVAVLILAGGGGRALGGGGLDGDQQVLVVLVAGAALLTLALTQLANENRRLRAALAAAGVGASGPAGPGASGPAGRVAGSDAPSFQLRDTAGRNVTLAELQGPGRPILLVFVSTHCGPCLVLLASLGRWQPALEDRLTLATVFSGDPRDVGALAEHHGLERTLIQEGDEVFSRYGLRATPSAVLVDADGRIDGPAAEGEPAIEALIRVVLARTEDQRDAVAHRPEHAVT